MKKYVWLDINTGKFSDSWDEETQKSCIDLGILENAKKSGWKLIEYTCLSDDKFEFYSRMKFA